MWEHTSDLPDEFFANLVDVCHRLECRPADLAACWMSESEVRPTAHNPAGHAAGIFQVMPSTLRGLGYADGWEQYLKLSPVEQLRWAEKYYAPHTGKLVSPGACYLATFLPALMAHADQPLFVLCARSGPFPWAYAGNYKAFDPNGYGHITVEDLTIRVNKVTRGPRWMEIAERIMSAQKARETDPDIVVHHALDLTSVRDQQTALDQLGYPCVSDGAWGPESRVACSSFQYDRMLHVDGVCGPITQAEMQKLLPA